MRVLLISGNIEKLPDPVVPLGPAYLCAALETGGHDVYFLDLCFTDGVQEALRTCVSAFSPEAVGLSIRNVDNVAYPQTATYLPFYKKIVEELQTLSSAPIFLGGAGFTIMPLPILRYLKADGGIAGEGEAALAHLLQIVSARRNGIGGDFKDVPGFVSPEQPAQVGAALLEDLDGVSPSWERIDLPKYHRRGGMANLQSKRGCPFACVYCTYPLIEGRSVRLRSPGRVAQDARALVERGIEHAFMVDNIFNFPEDHAREICRALIRAGIPLRWSCYAHPRYFSRALAEDMKAAGCTGVEFGTDSGSAAVLAKLGKSFSVAEIEETNRLAREAGLEVCHSLSLGAPGETEKTLEETFLLMERMAPTAVIAMTGLRIFPGTGLARLAEKEGAITPEHDFLPPTFYHAPGMKEIIVERALRFSAEHPNWIFPGLGINVTVNLQTKLRRIGVKGPLWEHMKILRRRRPLRREPYA